jgi:hypothetical protein
MALTMDFDTNFGTQQRFFKDRQRRLNDAPFLIQYVFYSSLTMDLNIRFKNDPKFELERELFPWASNPDLRSVRRTQSEIMLTARGTRISWTTFFAKQGPKNNLLERK